MAKITDTILEIEGEDLSSLLSYKVEYNKLWADGAARTMDGSMKATLIGIFTKLKVKVKSNLTEEEISKIIEITNKDVVDVTYYDPATTQTQTESFYFGDVTMELTSALTGHFEINEFSIIAMNKRSM